jgi:transcriptional regulator with XRE-family HTH domain
MTSKTSDLFRQLRDARRTKGLTQSALAAEAGCKQSAVSMLELGKTDAVNTETLARIAGILGVQLPKDTSNPPPKPLGKRFCPQGECPSNIPFSVNGELLFHPRQQADNTGLHCRYCGEVLESTCPNCGAAINEGACCTACGHSYVQHTPEGNRELWAAEQRKNIAELKSLF